DQQLACRAARAVMVSSSTNPAEQLTECAPQPSVACFSAQHTGGGNDQMCHPTMAMCRDHADHEKHEPGVSSVGACASSDPSAAVPDDPHWWCITFAAGKIGSCSRSKVRCEDDRKMAIELERGHPIDVTACASQASAQCFTVQLGSGDESASCHP